ncbi:sugar-binding transcriptional regulator (plasmid) [Gemmobacter fulvus]|uniref:Sugar-binding transcriptional regulator n=1 Tax=Gemmobacter fulvus TaxID=2840474 RepID=A0A975PBM5_9RHOB|nr:sugar-binding transcriptional regulator [Gemmobacter fulvus]MBT9246560.1 sugar-binding transcriptional regulator [Gemmobacter fulvus]QWK92653.1 sugar-binding transcriptional regulator [Gemmobacter fulvus]
MTRTVRTRDSEESLAIRAAWLHYAAGLTQAEVAKRLGVTNVKAHRLITRANEAGAVKVTIDGDIAECVELENQLAAAFNLTYCEVVPDLHEEGLPLRALGVAGAGFLQRAIDSHPDGVIGIGHGRTLAAAVADMPRTEAGRVRFVSLLGGLTRNYAANPHDVMHRLAEKTGATAFVMPVPFFANSVEDREVLLSQRGVSDVFALAAQSDLMIVGIGTTEPDAQLVSSRMVEMPEITEVKARGGTGEILGHFFDAEGRPIETSLTQRTLSLGLEELKGRRIVAIAGGTEKTCAIRSVLMSGCLSGLITDERTAHALANGQPQG